MGGKYEIVCGERRWLASKEAGRTTIPAVVVSAVIAVTCLLTGRIRGALLAIAAVPVAVGLCEVLIKPLVHRTYIGQVVYPSGHTATVFALAATITVLLLASLIPVLWEP